MQWEQYTSFDFTIVMTPDPSLLDIKLLRTPRADALIGTVRAVLAGLQRLAQTQALFDPSTAQRRFRICMTGSSHITLLPRLLSHVRAVAPGVVLEAGQIDGGRAGALQVGGAALKFGPPASSAGACSQRRCPAPPELALA